jgi:hypothetical protein
LGLFITLGTYIPLAILDFIWTTPSRGETWVHQLEGNMQKILATSVPLSAIGFVIDLYILIIPIAGVSVLTMSLKRKIGAMLILFSGSL